MINQLQSVTPFGGVPNVVQEQLNQNAATRDIRTEDAQRLQPQSVATAKEGAAVLPNNPQAVQRAAEMKGKETKPVPQEKTEPEAEEEKKRNPMVPAPPTPFDLAMAARQEKYVQTQQAVVQYFLHAGSNVTSQRSPAESETSVDVTA